MIRKVSYADVRAALIGGREIALLDVREEGPFSRGHPLFAVPLPLGRIELDALDLVPRLDAPIVLYDDGEGFVARAAAKLTELGYSDIAEAGGELAGSFSSTSTCRARRSGNWWNRSGIRRRSRLPRSIA